MGLDMKKSIILIIALVMPIFLFGQTYKSLWNQVEEAEKKDLPKTEYEVLQKIVKKATKEKAYGQLLKAELQAAQVMAEIAPDSLKPAMDQMQQHWLDTKDEVLRLVWQTVLYKVSSGNAELEMNIERPKLTDGLCAKLSRIKDEAYSPLVIRGADAAIFDHDLLHVIGYELLSWPSCVITASGIMTRYPWATSWRGSRKPRSAGAPGNVWPSWPMPRPT